MDRIRKRTWGWLLLALAVGLWGVGIARANAAPPESASGAGPAPDSDATHVRMVAEQVTLTVASGGRQAAVQGHYRLRNEGSQTERLAVRFPLSYLTDEGNARPPCPEIRDLQVRVDGQAVRWTRQQSTPISYCHQERAPWAVFEVAFPAGQDVVVEVAYTQEAWGYEPYWVLTYIVETGAGWYGTIGQGEIRVVMPYAVSPGNIVLDGSVGYGRTSPRPRMEGQTLIWTFTDLEPTAQDNIWVLYVDPEWWADVEKWRAQTRSRPQDGDAWGFLGLAIKRVIADPIGWEMARGLRADSGARALLQEALDAYAQAVRLAPEDPDWHFGYGELLAAAAQTILETGGDPAQAHAYQAEAARQLAEALRLNPRHEKTRTFLERYGRLLEGWVVAQGETFVFVGLTATPPAPTPRPVTPTPAPLPGSPEPTNVAPGGSPGATDEATPTQAGASSGPTAGASTEAPHETDEAGWTGMLCGLFGVVLCAAMGLGVLGVGVLVARRGRGAS